MSEENKNLDEIKDEVEQVVEEAAEEVTEAAEEVVEEATETTEEVVEEATEAVDGTAEEVTETAEEIVDGVADAIEEQPKSNKGLIAGIAVAVVVLIIAAVLAVAFKNGWFNKYNRMGYIDTSGKTIAEIADQSGYELKDFLAEFELPADMPGNTSESAAYYNIPTKKVAEMYGTDFNGMKEMLGWGDDITEDTPWGIAEGETTVGKYVGEENIEAFKEQYGFGDEVTADTKWKEIRNTIDQKTKDDRIAAEKAEKEAATADTEEATDATEASEEAPATEEGAEEAPAEEAPATEAK